MQAAQGPPSIELGPRERRWLILLLVLASAYVALLLAERLIDVLGGFSQILLILFLAWLLAFVMAPMVGSLQQRVGLHRPLATVLVYLLVLVLLGFALFYAGSAITAQVAELPAAYARAEERILGALANFSVSVGRFELDLRALYTQAVEGVADTVGNAVLESAQEFAAVTVAALGSLLLIVILSLYMVMDSARILGRMKQLVPRRYRDEAALLERSVVRAFGGFLRAQLILAALQAALVAVVCPPLP